MTTTMFHVDGMTCQHCVHAVTEEVSGVPHVTEVSVDLPTGRVTIESDAALDDALVLEAISTAGYSGQLV